MELQISFSSLRLFIMLDGWLELALMCNGLLSGLLYGSYLPVDMFNVKSKKLKTLRLVSNYYACCKLCNIWLLLFENNCMSYRYTGV